MVPRTCSLPTLASQNLYLERYPGALTFAVPQPRWLQSNGRVRWFQQVTSMLLVCWSINCSLADSLSRAALSNCAMNTSIAGQRHQASSIPRSHERSTPSLAVRWQKRRENVIPPSPPSLMHLPRRYNRRLLFPSLFTCHHHLQQE